MLSPVRLAVWGDPIDHSRSPALHAAAYRALDLPWEYGRERVTEAGFVGAVDALDATWRGLSLTMPLKNVAAENAVSLDDAARRTGAVNTYLLTDDGPRGFNTDVGGLARALREAGVTRPRNARILGAGATATSAVLSLAELGAERVEVVARRPEAAAALRALGRSVGVDVVSAAFDAPGTPDAVAVTIGALPGGVDAGPGIRPFAENGGLLVDVVYGTWPTPLAEQWRAAGNTAINGLPMLLHQALLQVRVFVGGDPAVPLEREDDVLAAMRAAVMGG
ncbi:MAG: shikimate dehydrogenase [Microbacterium sp. 71-36]|uniref:shikimate dehydrogenase family protein n=1 Tax=unclassified Microbacterium TaxID=2609290 RepID=UPI00086D7091|nr:MULTISPECIES: shikimate dehydrogenase [unclassified Microbacterium]MBN9212597.1 shikimate dehydrogenase [Microbacterium sp.]ODT39356.1 MAG: shikimate dehydrogenase [Microbacterium sp. SCN 71-17]OJV76927.1 MAG: shikimate dehydrogenase [Microbacterium sp. 71-36]